MSIDSLCLRYRDGEIDEDDFLDQLAELWDEEIQFERCTN